MAHENVALAEAFLAAIPTGVIADELVTEDFAAWTTSSGSMLIDKYRGGVRLLATLFADRMRIEIASTTAQDDRVAVEAESYGELIDGKTYRNRYLFLFRMRGGKVASVAEHNNPLIVAETIAPLMRAAMERAGG